MKARYVSLGVVSLLVAATPVFSASAVDNENTVINASVSSTIAMTATTATVPLTLTPTTSSVQSIASGSTTVNTNSATGYNLKIKDADATLNLVSGANTITPGSGSQATPAALTDGKWGWAVIGAGGASFDISYTVANNTAPTGKKFAGILATDAQFKSTASPASNDVTTLYYSAQVATTQASGTYTDTITLTATVNP